MTENEIIHSRNNNFVVICVYIWMKIWWMLSRSYSLFYIILYFSYRLSDLDVWTYCLNQTIKYWKHNNRHMLLDENIMFLLCDKNCWTKTLLSNEFKLISIQNKHNTSSYHKVPLIWNHENNFNYTQNKVFINVLVIGNKFPSRNVQNKKKQFVEYWLIFEI